MNLLSKAGKDTIKNRELTHSTYVKSQKDRDDDYTANKRTYVAQKEVNKWKLSLHQQKDLIPMVIDDQ